MLTVMGYQADTCYCIALSHYLMKQYTAALKYITEIIERGIKEHPGLASSSGLSGSNVSTLLCCVHIHVYNV